MRQNQKYYELKEANWGFKRSLKIFMRQDDR